MIDQGLLFTYITARDWNSSSEIMKEVKLELPIGVCNGSAILDVKSGRVLKGYYLEHIMVDKIKEIARRYKQIPKLTICYDDIIIKITDGNQHKGDVISVAFVGQTKPILALYEALNNELGENTKLNLYEDPFDKSIRIIDIVSHKASKGTAALSIAKLCGRIHSDRIIAFGNDNNDAELLKMSGLGIAIGNEAGKWKEAAAIHLEYENGYSVLNFIEEHFKNKEVGYYEHR